MQLLTSESNQPLASPVLPSFDFNKIKLHTGNLNDAVWKIAQPSASLKSINPQLASKEKVLKAINNYDLPAMREISNFFYKISGIYARILRYMAFMYRYDWFLTPYTNNYQSIPETKLLNNFYKGLDILDNFAVKRTLGETALKVLLNGCYYGYKIETEQGIVLQELPPNYCRSRFNSGSKSAVEFNMRYFDDAFIGTEQKTKMLNLFPAEFKKGYKLYHEGKLSPEFMGDTSGWYLLDPRQTVRFTANGEEYPTFISVIPLILDLEEAQDLEKRKVLQRLCKIVVQKIPTDKDGEIKFDEEEIQQLHHNAVMMLSNTIGVDVLTTVADVEVQDLMDSAAAAQSDDLERVERQLYNEAGVSQMQFNTDGNLALEKSILNDEATMYNLLLQFEQFLNELLEPLNKSKKLKYKVQLLTTTIYNYKELAKLYKEQTQLGYSKMLPQIALGQSQSSILANAYFENDTLDLVNLFIPPMSSNTMNADALQNHNSNKSASGEETKAGRKELDNDQKSEKTLQNLESAS